MKLHFEDAKGALAECEGWLGARLRDAFAASVRLLPLGDVDVVVCAGTDVIPEKGHLGHAPGKGVIRIIIDPDHPLLLANPDRSLERMFAHELHHCARWDGPGYGSTLGEALVSEGLAGHFVQEVMGGPPEPWECLPVGPLRAHVPAARAAWDETHYTHTAWFFGAGEMPRWTGYTLGYRLVGRYLEGHRDALASTLVHADAAGFRACLEVV